jgi:hypothetical protein
MVAMIILAAATATPQQLESAHLLLETYFQFEQKLAEGKYDFRVNRQDEVECIIRESSGDADLDDTFCQVIRICPRIQRQAGADNEAALDCLSVEQRKRVFALAAQRVGVDLTRDSRTASAANQ